MLTWRGFAEPVTYIIRIYAMYADPNLQVKSSNNRADLYSIVLIFSMNNYISPI